MRLEFPVVKLLDYADRVAELEAERNPFAAVVIAHLKTVETRHEPAQRRDWKVRLVKSLFDRELSAEEIRQLFRLIDWLLELPREFEEDFQEQIQRFEEERQMPYVTAIERMAREKGRTEGIQEGIQEGRQEGRREGEVSGLQEGIELALELKFGPDGLALMPLVREVERLDLLRTIRQTLRTAETMEPIQALLSQTD